VHPLSEANSNSPHHTQYSSIPTRNEVRTSSADTTIDCSTILHDLATHYNLWYLTDTNTNQPFIGSISGRIETLNHNTYTSNRDLLRGKDGRPPMWASNSLAFAGQRWKKIHPSTPQLNCRLICDKHVHGGNVTKWKLSPPLFPPFAHNAAATIPSNTG